MNNKENKIVLEKATITKPDLWIEVKLLAIKGNLKKIKTLTGEKVRLLAVIKANAYGHGMLPIAKALAGDVDFFGVSNLQEALSLRDDGISAPVLIFGCIFKQEVSLALANDISLTVSDVEHAYYIDDIAKRHNSKAKVHIKVDTGMGRLGIPYGKAERLIKEIAGLKNIYIEGIYTHFPVAEETKGNFTLTQIELFENLLGRLEDEGIDIPFKHAANSAGIVNFKKSHLNMVRPGIMLYGLYPSEKLKEKVSLAPALSLKTKLILIKNISRGGSVSYGRKYVAEKDTTIGVMPIGYRHGYPFALSNKAEVLIKGKRYPVAGRICMDYTMVDLGKPCKFETGETVTLIGKENSKEIAVSEIAKKADTINYEIVTRLSGTIPRLYS